MLREVGRPRRGRMAGALTALVLLWTVLLPAGADQAPPQAAHLTHAEVWTSSSHDWVAPRSLAESDDAVLARDTPWQQVDLPFHRPRQTVASADQAVAGPGVEWFRAKVPGDALLATPEGPRLYIPRWQTIGTLAVYVNGSLVWRSHGSRVWNSFNEPVWVDLSGRVQPGMPLELHVRMASQPGVGGALSTLWVGPAEALRANWRWRSYLQVELVAYLRGAFLVLGLLSLGVWLVRRRRGESGYLLFALLALCNALATLFYLVDAEGFDFQDNWFSWWSMVGSVWLQAFAFLLLGRMQERRPRVLTRVLIGYCAVLTVATLPVWGPPHQAMLPLLRMALLPTVLMVLWLAVSNAWRQRTGVNIAAAVAVVLTIPLGLHDLAMQRYLVSMEGVYLTPYVSMGVIMMFMLLAFARYNSALHTAERSQRALAVRLAEQESELNQAHQRLRAVEREQTLMHERQRLMRDMHDGVGSSLQSALSIVESSQYPQATELGQVLRDCVDDLKLSIDSLEPVDADLAALLGSLRHRLGPRLQAAGVTLHWNVCEVAPLPWLDPQSALHVLRILQEVLTNILKHGRATEIALSTCAASSASGDSAPGVCVCVHDNGPPFEPPPTESLQPGGRGLTNLRSRARLLGAYCAWAPSAGGTQFTLWLPLHQRA